MGLPQEGKAWPCICICLFTEMEASAICLGASIYASTRQNCMGQRQGEEKVGLIYTDRGDSPKEVAVVDGSWRTQG